MISLAQFEQDPTDSSRWIERCRGFVVVQGDWRAHVQELLNRPLPSLTEEEAAARAEDGLGNDPTGASVEHELEPEVPLTSVSACAAELLRVVEHDGKNSAALPTLLATCHRPRCAVAEAFERLATTHDPTVSSR